MTLKTESLPQEIRYIINDKGTEIPFTGLYEAFDEAGTYLCRQCGLALFRSQHKFHSGCGWASFDDEIENAIAHVPDKDGMRIEILCQRCHAHLGHIFKGEYFTQKNQRYCVNSLSLDFITDLQVTDTDEAILAAGCFWGVEFYLKKLSGVLKTEVGYIGGTTKHPTYQSVCEDNTGHLEAVRVVYDPKKLSYEHLLKYFFEIHDFTQRNGQGPDIGEQYLSAIFYYDAVQKKTALSVIGTLENLNYLVATKLLPMGPFWPAENYHQDYYQKNAKNPYCHRYEKIF